MPHASTTPPMVAIIGRKHHGKTTLTVRLAAEFHRRGHRVMTIKHGSHTFDIDPETTDTYRHYHEGHAERVAMAAPDKFALIERWDSELQPEEIARRDTKKRPGGNPGPSSPVDGGLNSPCRPSHPCHRQA